jgi:hypothetical protein
VTGVRGMDHASAVQEAMEELRRASSSGRRALLPLLAVAYGCEPLALDALDAALAAASLEEVPARSAELLTFSREFVQPLVAVELGELVADALGSQLRAQVGPSVPEPSASGTRRAVDPDGHRRTTLARTLLRADFRILILEGPVDVLAVSDDWPRVDAAIVVAACPGMIGVVRALVLRWPNIGVVLQADDDARRSALLSTGVARVEVRPVASPMQILVDGVRRVTCPRLAAL